MYLVREQTNKQSECKVPESLVVPPPPPSEELDEPDVEASAEEGLEVDDNNAEQVQQGPLASLQVR